MMDDFEARLKWLFDRIRMSEFRKVVGKKNAPRAASTLLAMWIDSLVGARRVTADYAPVRLNDFLLPAMRPVDVFGKDRAGDERYDWCDIYAIGLDNLISPAKVHILVHAVTDEVRAEVLRAGEAGVLLLEGLILRQDPVTNYYIIAPQAS